MLKQNIPSQHRKVQQQIAEQTAAFLAAGGEIHYCGIEEASIGDGYLAPAKFDVTGKKGNRLPTKKRKVQ